MNKYLIKAFQDIEKADAIMYAIESAYLTAEGGKNDIQKANRAANAFYALWDIIKHVQNDLEEAENE